MELVRVPPTQWSTRRRLKNAAIVVVARVALSIVRPIPRAMLLPLGRILGLFCWVILRDARRLARRNVDRVFGARAENGALVRRNFVELGALLADSVTLLRPTTRALDALPLLDEARRTLDEARAHGRGVVLVTAHFGPWERMASALVESGFALTTPVRASYDPRLDALVHAPLRNARGVHAIDRDAPSTPRALLRALRGNEIVGFLVDLRTNFACVRAPFLGHDAETPSAPARLALRTGAPLVVALATRDGVTVRRVRPASAPIARDVDAQIVALTTEINAALSAGILSDPTRWIWMHDRWRRTPLVRTVHARSAIMPYAANEDLPSSVRVNLPEHGQDIFRAAFNRSFDHDHDEQLAFRIGWSAVKRVYEKIGEDWVLK